MLSEVLLLCFEFFKTGLFAIGGGLATIPFLYDIADRMSWFTRYDVAMFIAISEATPGPVGINMATYAGYKVFGIFGGILSTLSLVAPSIIIILIIAKFLKEFDKNKFVVGALYSLKAVVIALFILALWNVYSVTLVTPTDAGMTFHPIEIISFAVMLFLAIKFKKLNPLIWIGVGAVIGIIFSLGT